MKFLACWIATAVAVGVAVWLMPGIIVVGSSEPVVALGVFSLVLAIINMGVRPVLRVLSLPITILTLGVFHFILNTLLIYLASWLTLGIFEAGIILPSFGEAFVASLIISLVSMVVNAIIGKD